MVKINANPVQPIITIKPLDVVPDYEAYDRMSKIQWREEVQMARFEVRSALNKYYYGDR